MKYSLLFIVVFSLNYVFAGAYKMNVKFIDGYTNAPITNEKVTIRLLSLKKKLELKTNNEGEIQFKLKAKHFLRYSFAFESDKYEAQIRDRYLFDEKDIQLQFEVYPSEKYKKLIEEKEKVLLESFEMDSSSNSCFPTQGELEQALSQILDNHLQLPYWYGDYGFYEKFSVCFTLTSNGDLLSIKVIESSDKHLNEEVIRLVRLLKSQLVHCSKNIKKEFTIDVVIDHSL